MYVTKVLLPLLGLLAFASAAPVEGRTAMAEARGVKVINEIAANYNKDLERKGVKVINEIAANYNKDLEKKGVKVINEIAANYNKDLEK